MKWHGSLLLGHKVLFLGVRKFHSGSALSAKDYYSILGVDKSASTKDIKKVHNDLRSQ